MSHTLSRFPTRTAGVNQETLMRGYMQLPTALKQMGFSSLREGQEKPIINILGQRDTLCILPTSTGKTAVFVIPTLCLGWKTLVFSPLVALMRDQVQGLQRMGIRAAQMSGMQTEAENAVAARQWMTGEVQLFYVAPERLSNKLFQEAMRNVKPDMVVMDEAHTLSQWADTFRSAYMKAGDFISEHNPKVVAAFTATCPPEVEGDIRRVLGMKEATRLLYYPTRENLKLTSRDFVDVSGIVQDINAVNGPTIVYCGTIEKVEMIGELLSVALPKQVAIFHGELPDGTKRTNQDMFMQGYAQVMVATNAFGMGVDKAQPLASRVLTPDGWRRMGELCVGDWVIGQNGKPTQIVAINERGLLPAFEVEFSDGARTVCADDHGWAVRTPKQKYRNKAFEVRKLSEFRGSLADKQGNSKWFIPMVDAVEFGNVQLPIPPYLLGILLGDGTLGVSSRFTNKEGDLHPIVARYLPEGVCLIPGEHGHCGIVAGKGKKNPVTEALRQLGLMGSSAASKFVPESYLLATPTERLELLRGLLDTDGHVAEPSCNTLVYVTTSERLKDAMMFLVGSLGGICTWEYKHAYYCCIRLPGHVVPFRRPRKLAAFKPKTKYQPTRCVVKVTAKGKLPMRCIQVSNPDGLYVTDDFIVTHNSDIRLVIHRDHPGSPEALAQETGRAGRDGKDSYCITYQAKDSYDLQMFFIRNAYPERADIEAVFSAIQRTQDSEGISYVTGDELGKLSGVRGFTVGAIMTVLNGNNVIESAKGGEKIAKIRFTGSSETERFKDYQHLIERGGDEVDKDGFISVDLDWLVSEIGVGKSTVTKYLRDWDKEGYLRYVPPFRGTPRRIIGHPSQIDYDRLQTKKEHSLRKLQAVMDYFSTADRHKHEYLKKYCITNV